MRFILVLLLPLLLQLFAYSVVLLASQGGGSFMGLLAMPVAGLSIPLLIILGYGGARSPRALGGLMLRQFALALLPPLALLVFRALES